MKNNKPEAIHHTPENAEKIADWLRNRGGIAIWRSLDLSRALQTVATPVKSDGKNYHKPAYFASTAPACIITDFADVLVSNDVMKPESQVPLAEYLVSKALTLV